MGQPAYPHDGLFHGTLHVPAYGFLGANRAFLDYYEFPSGLVIIGKTDEDMGWHQEEKPFRGRDG